MILTRNLINRGIMSAGWSPRGVPMPSFKVPCPSCEATVLIKNPNLVGTKVECPKCKYRFKVEAPKEDTPKGEEKPSKDEKTDKSGAAAAAPTDGEGKKKKKTDGKKNKKVLIGVGLGVVALALLGLAFFALTGGEDKPISKGGGGGTPPRSLGGPVSSGTGQDPANPGTNEEKKDTPPPKAPPIPSSTKDPTNLLPAKSIAVYRFDLGKIRQTPLGGPLSDLAIRDLFRSSMGFDLDQIDQYYHCVVGDKERAPFGLIRLKDPVAEKDALAKVVGLGPARTVNGKPLHTLKANAFLTAVGSALAARSLLAEVYDRSSGWDSAAMKTSGVDTDSLKRLGACVYDTQTLLIGDHSTLEQFLTGLNKDGYPEFQTVVRKAPPTTPKGTSPKGPSGTPTPTPGPTPPGPMTPGTPTTPPVEPAQLNKDFTSNPTFLSVSLDLKRLLNAMDDDPGGPPLMILAEKFNSAVYDRKHFKRDYDGVMKVINPVLDRTQYVALNVTTVSPRYAHFVLRLIGNSEADARQIALEHLTPGLSNAVPLLSLLLFTNPSSIEFRNLAAPGSAEPVGPGGPGGPGSLGGPGAPGLPGYPMAPGSPQLPGYPMAPGSPQLPGYPMGPGSTPQPPGGDAPSPPPGSMKRKPGLSAGDPGSGLGGPGSGSGMPPPGGPGGLGTQNPTQPPTRAGRSSIELRFTDLTVTITGNLLWKDEVYGRAIAPRLLGYLSQIKGKATVFAGTDTWFGLAQAVNQYVKTNNSFPRGTLPRATTDSARLNMPYPPDQRVSFFAELLPYLGRLTVSQNLNRDVSWYDEKSARATESWVPELLVSYYSQSSWRATSPLAPEYTFGGTNYVAVAGIGRDAARYDPTNPAQRLLVGISGYDWGSKVEEVTDGLENTIYLLQVPPDSYSRPWAAGGGATVVGLDPVAPMEAFKHTRPDGQSGTYAIMGNGTVRWIPADIDPKVFLAMVTRAGGEKLPNLDEVAPLVLRPGATAELKTVADPKPAPKPADPKPADPKPAPKPAETKGADPKPADPKPTEPKAAEPKAADPKAADPKVVPASPIPKTDAPKSEPAPTPKEKAPTAPEASPPKS